MKEWKEEVVYHEGERFFLDLGHALFQARVRIDLETYIFDQDALGNKIIKSLEAAAGRGVQVRILLDGVGCSQWSNQDRVKLKQKGVNVRFYHPLPWQNPHYRYWHYFTPRRLVLGVWKLNRRNHRKACLIDGKVAYLGGMNVSARHLGNRAWRDTSVRVQGESLSQLSKVFEYAWNHPRSALFRANEKKFLSRPYPLRLNLTLKQRSIAYRDLLRRLMRVKNRIWITNPYFIPEFTLIRALRFAAWSGVDVRILVPKKGDVWGLRWAIRAFYYILLSGNVRIFEYKPTILHAKTMLLDNWALVGSSNLNHRSLLHDLEVDVVLTQGTSLRSLEKQFEIDLAHSREIDFKKWGKRFWGGRILERLVLVFRRWL